MIIVDDQRKVHVYLFRAPDNKEKCNKTMKYRFKGVHQIQCLRYPSETSGQEDSNGCQQHRVSRRTK